VEESDRENRAEFGRRTRKFCDYKVHTLNNHIILVLSTDVQENCFKTGIKIYIKTAPTCFGVIIIIRERTI
jgi:hypothetical protein